MGPLTFITLTRNGEFSRALKEALAGSSRARLLADSDNFGQMLDDVRRLAPSAAILVLEADDEEKDFDFIRKLVAANPGTVVISAAKDASPGLILGSIRAGAREFLQLPIVDHEFETVLDRTTEFCQAAETRSKPLGRSVAVFSGKGGAGVSFLATNMAAAMNGPAILVDFNLQNGDAASFLGLEPRYSLADFVSNRARLDESLIKSFITPYSANLGLVAAPLEMHEAEEIEPEHITEILHLLNQRYAHIVLDLPHTFDPITIAALDTADDIILAMALDIPGIRSTKRALKVLERLGYLRTKIHIVVNRWTKNIDVELRKVEAHLGEEFLGFVPNDYRKVMDSINLGRPIVDTDPSSKITVEIKRIVSALAAANTSTPLTAQPQRKSLRGIFSRQTTPQSLELATNVVKT
jgi:pilus assembly protein CpaE